MVRLRFALTSDQLELLLAFEQSKGLGELAEIMAKDPSVVSRSLQRLAEDYPVLKKNKGRWEITPLGQQINEHTRAFLAKHAEVLSEFGKTTNSNIREIDDKTFLIIVNAQKGLLDASGVGGHNFSGDSSAERNILHILQHWRSRRRGVVHVKHTSSNPNSRFFRNAPGCEILTSLAPLENELIIEKEKSSAFGDTSLEGLLAQRNCTSVVLVGFTANECIDATARDAVGLGFTAIVIGDATATFDLRDPSGKLVKAERVHRLTLANISALYAKVLNTADLIPISIQG